MILICYLLLYLLFKLSYECGYTNLVLDRDYRTENAVFVIHAYFKPTCHKSYSNLIRQGHPLPTLVYITLYLVEGDRSIWQSRY